MICRTWHGWALPENADAYEELLRSEIVSTITERAIDGYLGMQVLRRDPPPGSDAESEFMTIMRFESLDAVRAFVGEDSTLAVVPPEARALLSRFDAHAAHFHVRVTA